MTNIAKRNLLIVFAKPPVAGLSKTRLIPALGIQGAADFQTKLLEYTLEKFSRHADWKTQLWLSSELQTEYRDKLKMQYDLSFFSQQGENLGEKMHHALAYSLSNFDKVSLIGTDCPALNSRLIGKTFAMLDQVDLVLTPAEDGGYVQIAAKKIDFEVFRNVKWGGVKVMQQTRENLEKTRLSMALTETLWDVDLPEDLERLQRESYALARDLPPVDRLDSQP